MEYRRKLKQLQRMIIAHKIGDSIQQSTNKRPVPTRPHMVADPILQQQRSMELDRKLENGRALLYPIFDPDKEHHVPSIREFVDRVMEPIESRYGSQKFIQVREKLKLAGKVPQLKLHMSSSPKLNTTTDRTDVSQIIRTELFDTTRTKLDGSSDAKSTFEKACLTARKHLERLGIPQPTTTIQTTLKTSSISRKKTHSQLPRLFNHQTEQGRQNQPIHQIMTECKSLTKDIRGIQRNYKRKLRVNDRTLIRMDNELKEFQTNNFLRNDLVFI